MKFIHVADLHIGKYLNQKSLIIDQQYILNQILEYMENYHVSNIIISGDIYDRPIPSKEAVKIFNEFLTEAIIKKKYKVYIISGNHDSIERLDFASDILKSEGLFIESIIKLPLTKYEVSDEYGSVNIYMMPYCSPLYTKTIFEENVTTYSQMIKYFIENSNIDYKQRNILITHHTVLHNNTALISDSEANISIGGTLGIEGTYFTNFDYVALGHLHNPQYITKDYIRYSGSILKYSESEASYEKSCVYVSLKEKGNIDIKPLILKPLHDLKKIAGHFDELIKNPQEEDRDYIYFSLLDEQIIPNAMSRLRVKYPNAVSLNYKNIKSVYSSDIKVSNGFHDLTLSEQFGEFFQTVMNKKLNANQLEILNDIIVKGKDCNETD